MIKEYDELAKENRQLKEVLMDLYTKLQSNSFSGIEYTMTKEEEEALRATLARARGLLWPQS